MASKYKARDLRPFQIVHVTCRGHQRKPIFLDPRDHAEFDARLRRLIHRCPPGARPKQLAGAAMLNHRHLLLQNGGERDSVSPLITSLKIGYAKHFNDRYGATGPVFESPFRSRLVIGGDDLANVITYIHLNPDASVRATSSTHAVYTGESNDPFIDTTAGLRAFGGRENYIEFFNDTARLRAARAAARRRL